MPVRDYPWRSLERVPRQAVRSLRAVRARWEELFSAERLESALSELAGTTVTVELLALAAATPPAGHAEVTLELDGSEVTLGAEPALVLELLERALGRPFALKDASPLHEPALAGAFAALCVEAARRAADAPVTLATARELDGAVVARASLRVAGKRYSAYARAFGSPQPVAAPERPRLAALGDLPLSVPLVVGLSLATRDVIATLVPGAAFVPGDALWVDRAGNGHGALAAATSELGVRVDLAPADRIVLREQTLALAPDRDEPPDTVDEAEDTNPTLIDSVLDAPVVVRIELGSVSMPASDWARLRPGDVIESGQRVAGPVVLRAGGRIVARGELVDVEGELGVRVRELVGGR